LKEAVTNFSIILRRLHCLREALTSGGNFRFLPWRFFGAVLASTQMEMKDNY